MCVCGEGLCGCDREGAGGQTDLSSAKLLSGLSHYGSPQLLYTVAKRQFQCLTVSDGLQTDPSEGIQTSQSESINPRTHRLTIYSLTTVQMEVIFIYMPPPPPPHTHTYAHIHTHTHVDSVDQNAHSVGIPTTLNRPIH